MLSLPVDPWLFPLRGSRFHLPRLAPLVLAGILTLLVGGGAFGEESPDRGLRVQTDPRVGILSLDSGEVRTGRLPNLLHTPPKEFAPDGHYVLQLDGPITPERRTRLEVLGFELLNYLPHFAYVCRAEAVDPSRLPREPGLIWLGEYQNQWKLARDLGERVYRTEVREAMAVRGQVALVLTLFPGVSAATVLERIRALGIGSWELHRIEPVGGNVTLSLTVSSNRVNRLVNVKGIQFVEEAPEVTYRNNSNRWIVQSNQAGVTPLYTHGLHGEGQVAAVMDGRVDVGHCSFEDSTPIGPAHRKILAYNTGVGSEIHGTHVAGTALGDSGADNHNRGVAYAAKLVFNLPPSFTESGAYNRLRTHHNQGARIHTNSWGDDGTTQYNSLCRGIDSFSRDFEDSLVLFAATNTGTLRNPENAKNLIAVGASLDAPNQENHCSGGVGPTADGRRKPELFAPGCGTISSAAGTGCSTFSLTGTSMACPAIAGAALLTRQYYVDGYYPSGTANPEDSLTPSGALIKATLMNSGVNMTGIAGYPSDREGWGRLELDRSLYFPGDSRALQIFEDLRNESGLTTGEVREYSLAVTSSSPRLNVTMVFTDVPASAGTGSGLAAVNDLDLEVVSPTGTLYRGNVFANGESTSGGISDPRNNVEQVQLTAPAVGDWTVRVRGSAVNQAKQGFALLASGGVTPDIPPLRITLPDGAPRNVREGVGTQISVRVRGEAEALVGGSATLYARVDGGAFQSVGLTHLQGDDYRAVLPAANCQERIEFYFSARGDRGSEVTLPDGAPGTSMFAEVGSLSSIFSDDFEVDHGWTVENTGGLSQGAWERAVPSPEGGSGNPLNDFDGSGRCLLTGNGKGETDVDGGLSTITSPPFDFTASDPLVGFAYWFFNDSSDDSLKIEISQNGTNWIPVETVGPGGSGGWTKTEFRVRDYVDPGDQVRVRFVVSDLAPDSRTEAAIDDFQIREAGCYPIPERPDLGIAGVVVDYDPVSPVIDAGPGALGQAVDVVVTIRNSGTVPITAAEVVVEVAVPGDHPVTQSRAVEDFAPSVGTQALDPGAQLDVVVSFPPGQLDRCGTYRLSAFHREASFRAQGAGGSLTEDVNPENDVQSDFPDSQRHPQDDFSPDLLELEFGTLIATILSESEIIEDRATEKVRVQIDYRGLGPGLDSHDLELAVDLTNLLGATQYLNVFKHTRLGAGSAGSRRIVLRVDVSDANLFPSPPLNSRYRLRFRLRDLNSNETCVDILSPNSAVLE